MNLVTGGTGLVGAHILYDLCQKGGSVKALKRETSDLSFIKNLFEFYSPEQHQELISKVEWINADLLDVDALIEATKGVEFVYHAAAIVSFDKKDRNRMLKANIEGTQNLMTACTENKIQKVGYISSIATLGPTKDGAPKTENTHWEISKDNSNYAISKYGAEREVWRAGEEGLKVVMVNPGVIFGPGDWTRSSTTMFKTGYDGLKYFSSGTTGFVDVRDISKSIIQLVHSNIESERFIMVSETKSFGSVFTSIAKSFGKRPPWKTVTKFKASIAWRLAKIKSWFTAKTPALTKETAKSALALKSFSSEKVKQQLDFKFITIEQSIKDTSAFLKQFYIQK